MIRPLLSAALIFLPIGLLAQTIEPLTIEGKLQLHAYRVIEPHALFIDTFRAGMAEIKNDPGTWTRDGTGFAKRFGTEAGRSGIRETLGFGLDAALHTDPRTYRSMKTSFRGRLYDALSQVVIARTDSGNHVPAIANVTSAFAAGQIQTIWMPANDAHFKDGLATAGIVLLGDATRNVFKEFWPDIKRKLHHGL